MLLNKKLEGLFGDAVELLNQDQQYWLRGLNGSALAFFIQTLVSRHKKNLLVVASDKEKAAYILNDLDALVKNERVLFFPETYRQPYQVEKTTNANIQERAEVLNLLSKDQFKGIVVTYPQALCEKVTLKKQLNENTLQIKKGENRFRFQQTVESERLAPAEPWVSMPNTGEW